jgi:asparagine synthase (glutamine-hydrolysing)
MPGIVDFCGFGAIVKDAALVLTRMRAFLEHEPSYLVDDPFCDGLVACTGAHVDVLPHVPQPAIAGAIRVWLDGEFFNQAELPANTGPDSSDADIIADLAARAAVQEVLDQIDGSYASVIYDAESRTVTIVADRYGSRPLHWVKHGNGIAWSTESKALLALPGFVPKINHVALDQFLELGHLLGTTSWLEGVGLLAPATALTWRAGTGSTTTHRYWSWDRIRPLDPPFDERELARELADRFVHSVQRRAKGAAQAGVLLSGGIDSRGILAAMAEGDAPIETLTFGKPGCMDVRIARRAARRAQAHHHVWEMTRDNWLQPRIPGIWWTECAESVLDMHGIEARHLVRELFPICVFGGECDSLLQGDYLEVIGPGQSVSAESLARRYHCRPGLLGDVSSYAGQRRDLFFLENHMRQVAVVGPLHWRTSVVIRQPYSDNRLVELAYSLPDHMRENYQMYRRMMLSRFRDYFQWNPWTTSGVPLSWPGWARLAGRKAIGADRRAARLLAPLGTARSSKWDFHDYPNWLRAEPAVTFFRDLLTSRDSLYQDYVPRRIVVEALARRKAGLDNSKQLGRYVTLEIWLRQLFMDEFRPHLQARGEGSRHARRS